MGLGFSLSISWAAVIEYIAILNRYAIMRYSTGLLGYQISHGLPHVKYYGTCHGAPGIPHVTCWRGASHRMSHPVGYHTTPPKLHCKKTSIGPSVHLSDEVTPYLTPDTYAFCFLKTDPARDRCCPYLYDKLDGWPAP